MHHPDAKTASRSLESKSVVRAPLLRAEPTTPVPSFPGNPYGKYLFPHKAFLNFQAGEGGIFQ